MTGGQIGFFVLIGLLALIIILTIIDAYRKGYKKE